MTPLQMTEAICKTLVDAAASLSLDPEDGIFLPDEIGRPTVAVPWVRLTIIPLAGTTMTHGPTRGRLATRRGYVIVQCFAPGDGTGGAIALAIAVRDLFEGRDITAVGDSPTAINFTTADIKPKGLDGAWVRADVEADFTYGETV